MTVSLGINPLTWSNDDMPELGGETPLETCLLEAHLAGFEGIELGIKFPRTRDELHPLLDKHALALVSGWYGARLLERDAAEEIEAVDDHLGLLADMGCPVMVFAEVSGCDPDRPMSARPVLADGQWSQFAERLTAVAEHLAERGVPMAFHHHMGTVVQTEDEIDRLMETTGPAVGLLLDTGHLTYAGGDPVSVARRHASRINHVHCKDVRPGGLLDRAQDQDWTFPHAIVEGVFTVPGDGTIDFPAVLGALGHGGYEGWLVVEADQDPAKAHPLTYARMGYRALAKAVKASGI
ncbi:MAG: myo-inosose-2 dehydratase [Proteobacteria bacterium]|nr:myo-inosose-2 dehydratase [Pseudomonadota bacterium]